MATKTYTGSATAVAQVSTASIDSMDGTPANNTFTVTIGGVSISQAGDTDVATTAAAMVVLLNASTHPYFAAITWTNPSAGNITATADVAGCPFIAALTETGAGTGSVTDFSDATACTGPNFADDADNWSGGSLPVSTDTVVLTDSATNICWGLDLSSVTLAALDIENTYTGRIGLNVSRFATSADGQTTVATAPEYRDHYLQIDYDAADIGKRTGTTSTGGSARIKLDNQKAGASTTTVHTTSTGADSGKPAVSLLLNNASADVTVRSGSVGVAIAEAGETSTIGDVIINDRNASFYAGEGVTLANYTQNDGIGLLNAAATITSATVNAGALTTEGDYTITTLAVLGGTVYVNHVKTAGNAITTLTQTGGTVDATQSSEARTWATVNPDGGTIKADEGVITITTLNQPSGVKSMAVT